MLDFFKNKKRLIIIFFIVVCFLGYKIYKSQNEFIISESSEIFDQESVSKEENDSENNIKENDIKENSIKEELIIHIAGEVKKPGIVKVKEGSRIEDVIAAAGGLTENADITNVNLAYVVQDGIKIRIPSINDEDLAKEKYIIEGSGEGIIVSGLESANSTLATGKSENIIIEIININKAPQEELQKLPGIGTSLASRIVEYRKQNGNFSDIEEIKNVSGIGESKFEKIKDFIKV